MFRSKQCVFLGYSAQHKGVKCLDVSTGRVDISRDVVFDETKFPFADLHPNAGALLRKEILLLPPHLSGVDQGGNNGDDQPLTNPLTDDMHEPCGVTGENNEENDKNREENCENNPHPEPYFMCPESGDKSSSGSFRPQGIRSSSGSVAADVSEV